MPHAVTQLPEPFTSSNGAFRVHLVPVWHDNLVWLITQDGTDRAWAVDGPEAEPVLRACERLGKRLVGLLTTHTHPDHIGIHRELAERGTLSDLTVYGARRPAQPIPGRTHPLDGGDTVNIDGLEGRVLSTEGHQNGHISYVFDDVLFCGDTLFAGGCGYLFDGPPEAMFDSLLRLAALPGSTRVCCAHEYTQDNLRFAYFVEPDNPALAARIAAVWSQRAEGRCTVPSTIDDERATNPFLRPGSPTVLATLRERSPDADLSSHVAVFSALRALKDRKEHQRVPDEALPLDRG